MRPKSSMLLLFAWPGHRLDIFTSWPKHVQQENNDLSRVVSLLGYMQRCSRSTMLVHGS